MNEKHTHSNSLADIIPPRPLKSPRAVAPIGKSNPTFRVLVPVFCIEAFFTYVRQLGGVSRISKALSPSSLYDDWFITISFENIPDDFQKFINAPMTGVLKTRTLQVDVDRHFNGFTSLNHEESPVIDIVAVSGLGAHAFGSWKVRGQDDMWLRDYLPQDLAKQNLHARVMIYGYDSRLENSRSHASLDDYSKEFLEALKSARSQKFKKLPLILIGHSLGGLVIKHALKEAAQGNEEDKMLFKTCHSIIFFGVPNRGMEIENLQTMVKGQPNERLVSDLGASSQLLPALEKEFYRQFKKLADSGSKIISFYETEETPIVQLIDGRWQRNMDAGGALMVNHYSAINSASGENFYDQIPIRGDHSNMVKFMRNSTEYYNVRNRISEWVKTGPEIIKARFESCTALPSEKLCKAKAQHSDPETMENDHSLMLLQRNSDFVGRYHILTCLEELLKLKCGYQPRVALWGLGGIGKTQIAIEYCYRLQNTSIFWIHGRSDDSFKSSIQQLSQRVGIYDESENEEKIILGVKYWLESKKSGQWLLVVDNLDDIRLSSTKYLPSRNGRILFTTRDAQLIGFLTPVDAGIEVSSMNDQEASDTLLRNLGNQRPPKHTDADRDVNTLNNLLGNFPLAVAQAAAYIRHTRTSLSEYIKILQTSEEKQARVLSKPLRRADQTDPEFNSAMTTWNITFEALKKDDAGNLAIKLLRILSFLDPEEIQTSLIERNINLPELQDDLNFKEAAGLLLDVGFISELGNQLDGYRMHRLVSLWTRRQLTDTDSLNDCLGVALDMISNAFPENFENFMAKQIKLMPHASSVIAQADNRKHFTRSYLCLNINVSEHLIYSGNCNGAETYAQRCVAAHQLFPDVEKSDTLHNRLGMIYHHKGRYTKALEYCRRALAGREKTVGKEHLSTLRTVNNMAVIFAMQSNYEKALEWYGRALDGHEKALGKEHPFTLDIVRNMAIVFEIQGNYEKALEWYERALDGYEKALGKEHLSTLDTVCNMAGVFEIQCNYEKALEWYGRALDGREKTLGKEHPSTLDTVNNMAVFFQMQGNYEKALEWYGRALDGHEKALGKEHLSTLRTVNNMAGVFQIQGNYEKALGWYERALDGREKALGKEHPSTLDTVNNMAVVFKIQGNNEKALEWYGRALDGYEKTLGKEHPSTLCTVNNMADVFQMQGNYEKALEWYERALDGREKTLGKEHPSTLDTVNNMAVVFQMQGNYEKTLEWYERALDGREKTLGKEHPSTLDTVNNMAVVFKIQGNNEKALEWYERALDGYEKALGKEHLSTLKIVNNMASMFAMQGNYEKALEWYGRALDGHEKVLGKEHPSTLDTVHNMAIAFAMQGNYEKALKWYERALDEYEKVLGKEHISTLNTVHDMASVFVMQGNIEKALEWYIRSLAGRKKKLGESHRDTIR